MQGVRRDISLLSGRHRPVVRGGIYSQAAGVEALRVKLELDLLLLSVCVFSSPHTRIFAPKEGRAEATGAHVLTESHVLPVLRVHGSTQMWPMVVFLPWSWLLSAALWCGASGARAFTHLSIQQGGHRKPSSYAAVKTMDCFQSAPGVSSNYSDCLLPWATLQV